MLKTMNALQSSKLNKSLSFCSLCYFIFNSLKGSVTL